MHHYGNNLLAIFSYILLSDCKSLNFYLGTTLALITVGECSMAIKCPYLPEKIARVPVFNLRMSGPRAIDLPAIPMAPVGYTEG